MENRVHRLRQKMEEQEISALFLSGQENLVSGVENLRYLTGFTGSAGAVLLTPDAALFFADPRYHLQAKQECKGFEVIACSQRLLPCAVERIKETGIATLGVEKGQITLGQHLALQEELTGVTLQPTADLVAELRQIKEPEEVEAIRRACELVDRAFSQILSSLKEGVSERDVAIELDYTLRKMGADKTGFDSIVAFGPHSAHPHARPTDRRLERGQFVKMDFGAQMNNYNSDLTRTVVFGPASDRHREIYAVVREAQERALLALRPGIPGKEVDAAAREYIQEKGYGDCFGHGLGHGLGREVHDGGALNPQSEILMTPGQVWTVEPGVYIEGFGGVRIEDDVVVTDNGCDILTSAPKEFQVID
ncbi:MAG: Xaa-Pro peptidase family protein [Armatimonadetes bacterium]|nr:Xaa-Pro peptidase family protein [Armatimonadota bacterium]